MKSIKSGINSFKEIIFNLKRTLKLSWQTDKFLTAGYYGTSGLSAVFPIVASYIYKLFIDNTLKNMGIQPSIPIILIAILGARYISGWFWDVVSWVFKETYFDYLMRYKLQNKFNNLFCDKISHLDIQHLENSETQDLINKAKDTMTWRPPDFLRAFSYLFTNLVSLVSSFILLAQFNWYLPFILLLFGLPRLYLRAKMGAIQWSVWGSSTPESRKMWYLQSLLTQKNSIIESKIFQSTDTLVRKSINIQTDLYEKNKKPVQSFIKVGSIPQFFEMFVVFGFALARLPLVLTGQMSVGDFSFFIDMLDRVLNSVAGTVGNLGWMFENNLYVNHFFEVMNLPRIVHESENPTKINPAINPPEIEFKNVSFSYPNSKKKALKNLSFKIKSGENIALVGKNGAGKTTIVKLLCRFYDVSSGEILINGTNIKDVGFSDWYKYLGTLFQEFIKYDFTVKENITLGKTDNFDFQKMVTAAKQSGADKFINELPGKYDQILGKQFEGGIELSIGQWQKIAIARAFYEGAPVLILDEPTSAIDAESEYAIFKNLDKEYKNKSLLIISHRFSTVRSADRILVLENGEIIEEGTHQDLIAKKGEYSKMFNKQAIGYK
jgi:ATP-binding cassette subfamily B protein/ATP-binding cassette subfamily C protein